jgi:hypothetical protein
VLGHLRQELSWGEGGGTISAAALRGTAQEAAKCAENEYFNKKKYFLVPTSFKLLSQLLIQAS